MDVDTLASDVAWTYYYGLAVPSSGNAGPLTADGDVARCFAHSQSGALIAAVQISAHFHFSEDWRTVAGYQLAEGPGRDVAVQRRAAAIGDKSGSDGGSAAFDPQRVRQVAGFQVVAYSDDAATIRIAASSPTEGTLVSSTYSLVWSDGDWKLKPSDSGTTSVDNQRLAALTGYTPWGESAGRL